MRYIASFALLFSLLSQAAVAQQQPPNGGGSAAPTSVPIQCRMHHTSSSRVSFCWNGPIDGLLMALGAAFNKNITVANASPGQSPTIMLTLNNVTLGEALQRIATRYQPNFAVVEDEAGITLVSEAGGNTNDFGPLTVKKTYQLTYAVATDIAQQLNQSLAGKGSVVADKRSNQLFFIGPSTAVSTVDWLVKHYDTEHTVGGMQTVVLVPQYITVDDATTDIKNALAVQGETNVAVTPSIKQQSVTVVGPEGAVHDAENALASADTPPYQVLVAVHVYDVTPDAFQSDIGLTYGSGSFFNSSTGTTGGVFLGKIPIVGQLPIGVQLNALIQSQKAKIIADPNTMAAVGETGKVFIGDQVTYIFGSSANQGVTTSQQTAGINLQITPKMISPNGLILMQCHAEFSQFVGQAGASGVPDIAQRWDDTTMYAHDGQTIAFAGLVKDSETTTTTKLPLLGDIPLFGYLFRNTTVTRNKEQLVFTLTPTVVKMK